MRFSFNLNNNPKRSLGDGTMKKLFTTVALVALVATPVLAQTKDRATQRTRAEARQTYTTQVQQQRSANRANSVYDIRGQYVGTDPDPAIRAQLANDPAQTGD
jgi:Flp pilus assembly protein TadD